MARQMAQTALRAALALLCVVPVAAQVPPGRFRKVVFGSPSADIQDFEAFATRAKQSGATHINITAEDLPWARWQYDTPGDPYPSWVISNTGLLKVAVPAPLRPYIPKEYSETVMGILEQRCKVLRRLGLKAAFNTFEPQMLPEAVFREHPLWRGARVDHPNRSRVARFAPSIDHPEVLALYRDALAELVRRCPEIDLLTMRTNDSGTGLDWSDGLYSGSLGNTLYRHRTMEERFRDFYAALREGARIGSGQLEIDMIWTREREPARIARRLPRGAAIENLEGPGATPFKATAGDLLDYEYFFYPVPGIPRPLLFLEGLEQASRSRAPRLVVSIGDRLNRDLYFRIHDAFWRARLSNEVSRLAFIHEIAAGYAGADNAETLASVWRELREAQRVGEFLKSGGHIFYLGCVQQRWLTRPFVPFPEELKPEEKLYYRKYQFQARTEAHADNLTDLQANHIFRGYGASLLAGRLLSAIESSVGRARRHIRGLKGLSPERQSEFDLLSVRLDVFVCLIRNARNAISYQAQLDRMRALGMKPDPDPVPGTRSGWDRQRMMETARAEIDNTAQLMELLKSRPEPLLHLAPVPEDEDIRILGPALLEHLQRKLDTMNAHWEDYKRIFTTPNL